MIHARGALRSLVGKELAERLDWGTLRLEPGSYVEESLRDSMSDLLFSVCRYGSSRRGLVYLLWDHQRNPDRLMPLRLLNYGGQALRDYTQRDDAISGYVPRLIPVVIFQGAGAWPGPHLLSELGTLPDEPPLPIFMDLAMIVHELRDDSLPPDELTTLARTTSRLLRLAALGELIAANAIRIVHWLEQVHCAHGYDDYRALMEYIGRAGRDEDLMSAIIEHSSEDLKYSAMSIADKLEARGWARGRAEGEALGRAMQLLRLLEHRFGPLAQRVDARVLEGTVEDLERWALRTLDVATIEDVFAEPR